MINHRVSTTSDGSLLVEFFDNPVHGVEIYPNGDVIIITRDDEKTYIHSTRLPWVETELPVDR